MYDAIGRLENKSGSAGGGGLYEVPSHVVEKKDSLAASGISESNGKTKHPTGSAVLTPSSIIHRSSQGVAPLRQTALDPTSVDTDKDTQQLVEEDKSEC